MSIQADQASPAEENIATKGPLPALAEAEAVLHQLTGVFYQNGAHRAYPADTGSTHGEERYRALVEQISAIVFMAYFDRGIGEAYVSPQIEEKLGFTQAEWLEDPVRWYQQIHPLDKDRWSVEAAQVLITGEPLRSAYRVMTRDGRVVWFQCEAKLIRRDDGRPWFIHGVAFDISDLKRTEQALEEERNRVSATNEELEAFSYTISHDLRAPLRHMEGFLELLKHHVGGGLDEKGRHYLDTVLDSSRQMSRLIDDLLGFSRMGRVKLRKAWVCMADLVIYAQRTLAGDLGGRQVVWTVDPLPEVMGDAALLRQAIVNLVSNSIKYSRAREQAAIAIGCREEGNEWIFFVRDNGVGFDMRYVHKLFGVFQRLHRAEEFEGSGIGLAIVQRVVGRHGGRTWAEGVLGEGATFYFSLPRTDASS